LEIARQRALPTGDARVRPGSIAGGRPGWAQRMGTDFPLGRGGNKWSKVYLQRGVALQRLKVTGRDA